MLVTRTILNHIISVACILFTSSRIYEFEHITTDWYIQKVDSIMRVEETRDLLVSQTDCRDRLTTYFNTSGNKTHVTATHVEEHCPRNVSRLHHQMAHNSCGYSQPSRGKHERLCNDVTLLCGVPTRPHSVLPGTRLIMFYRPSPGASLEAFSTILRRPNEIVRDD